jgi:ATP-dependent helicase Lhr and Lhr-like helicase
MDAFTPATRRWFEQSFAAPTRAQALGWPAIAAGRHTLITAPTGSGKTLAAFLWAIDRLMRPGIAPAGGPGAEAGTRILYISPLKALVYDIERNLRAPLAGIARTAEASGSIPRPPRVAVRTGDTPQRERQRQLREPAEILATTPESLFLLLGSRAAGNLAGIDTVILDEVHALAPTKRGAHLALSLERLAAICRRDPQRIGLSATIRPLEEAARFVGGDRPVEVVDAAAPPRLDLRVVVPVPDMARPPPTRDSGPGPRRGGPILAELDRRDDAAAPPERGLWSAIYPALLGAIRAHRSTIVFVNSRGLAERLCRRLNELAGEDLVQAHHGSVSHARRAAMEDALKRGALRGIVATSSLELGIDMGAVDQVLLVESPGSVARGLQRVGRAGHGVGEVSRGRIYPKFRGDLLECAVVAARMLRGELESFRIPRNALDVLAQQIVAVCCGGVRTPEEILALARRAAPYRDLTRPALEAVLDMLSGRYPSQDFADLKPLLAWDRAADTLSPRRGAAMLARLNAGTIPDRGNYAVHLAGTAADGTGESGGSRIGELDEEMVHETKTGDCILLGASTWRVESIGRDRVLVSPAPGEPGRLPFWRGDGPGRPLELGRALGEFTRKAAALGPAEAAAWIGAQAPLDGLAAANLAAYVREQRESTGQVPSDRVVVVERFRDEVGDWRLCILSPFGARIHAPWALALQAALAVRAGFEAQVMYTDDGIVLRLADGEDLPGVAELFPDPEDLEDQVMRALGDTALYAGLFRENAVRSLLMPRRSGRGRRPLWALRLKSQALLAAVRRYPAFPVVLETYRQALSDVFDLPGLRDILTRIRSRAIRVHEVETVSASPFARSLVFAYVAAYLYEQDAPLAERRAQALTLDRSLLAELVGQAELRELIDPEVLAGLEAELQHLDADRRARDPDELHDLLRRLGDLTPAEAAQRCSAATPVDAWLGLLQGQRRAVPVRLGGETRWIAAEDAGLYRDALGVVPPGGLPEAYLARRPAPLEHLLMRYARTHGPFPAWGPAARLGLQPAQVEPALRLLEAQGTLVRGEIRPLGTEPEWCDAEVLRRLRRRTLAALRQAVAPVDAATLGRFLPAWHGIMADRLSPGRRPNPDPDQLFEAVGQLEGLRVPWSHLERVLLPARVPGYRPEALDLLAASGRVVWVGCGAAGPRDGRVALYRRETVGDLLDPAEEADLDGPLHRALLGHLAGRGACFLTELTQAVEAAAPGVRREELEAALWDLVWAGRITNDTFAPLRALAGGSGRSGRAARSGRIAGGRWSLLAGLAPDRPAVDDQTRRALAGARMLLERYGVVSREAVQAEALPGGFGPVYRVLKDLEESGRVRRGWFCEGLSGAQFALPGALDRLRAARLEDVPVDGYGSDQVCTLAAIDPANPYGALVPWPATAGQGTSPRRIGGAWVVLVAGSPAVYVAPGRRQLLTFPGSCTDQGGELALALAALHRLPDRRRLAVRDLDGVPAPESPLRAALIAAGFALDYDALVPAAWGGGQGTATRGDSGRSGQE